MSRFPSEQSDASEGPLSERGAVDRLIDLSLSEWLAGAVPTTSNASLPELVSKRSQQSVFSNAQLDRALDDARLDIEQIAEAKSLDRLHEGTPGLPLRPSQPHLQYVL